MSNSKDDFFINRAIRIEGALKSYFVGFKVKLLKRLKKIENELMTDSDIFTRHKVGEDPTSPTFYFLKSEDQLINFLKREHFSTKEIIQVSKYYWHKLLNSGNNLFGNAVEFTDFLIKREDSESFIEQAISLKQYISDKRALSEDLSIFFQCPTKFGVLLESLKKALEEGQNVSNVIAELQTNIARVNLSIKLLKNDNIRDNVFPEWSMQLQLMIALKRAFETFDDILKDQKYRELLESYPTTVQEFENLKSEFSKFDVERTLKLAQQNCIFNIEELHFSNSLIQEHNELIKKLEDIEFKVRNFRGNMKGLIDLPTTRSSIESFMNDYNQLALKHNFLTIKKIPNEYKDMKRYFINFEKILVLEKQKRDYLLLIQLIIQRQIENKILEKVGGSDKYKIIDEEAFEKLGELTKKLLLKYTAVKQSVSKELNAKSRNFVIEDSNLFVLLDLKKFSRYDKRYEEILRIKENSSKIIQELNERFRTMSAKIAKTQEIKQEKQDKQKIKTAVVNLAIAKQIESKKEIKFSNEETMLIAKNDFWNIKNKEKRETILSNQISYMPDTEKFPNGKEHIVCPCSARERMISDKKLELTLKLDGSYIGLKDIGNITWTITIEKPETAYNIINYIRDKKMTKKNQHFFTSVEPRSAERAIYDYFGSEHELSTTR